MNQTGPARGDRHDRINGIDIFHTKIYTALNRKAVSMKTVKTAISIEKPLFDEIDALARRRNTSRSRIFALAAQEYIHRQSNRELLDALNSAHEDGPDPNEIRLEQRMRKIHAKVLEDRW